MATSRIKKAARKNIKKAQKAARKKRTISKLPSRVRSDLGREGAKAARRGGQPGHAYEERTREQLYEIAKEKGIEGRSKMGKGELIKALRRN
jgi:hypothetical protein